MVYPNLAAEMARAGITSKDVAVVVGKTPDTVNKWMNGKGDFPIGKAFALQATFFPKCSIEYLFASADLLTRDSA